MNRQERNRRILAFRGALSFEMIARELGISRNTVAGVVWRHKNPVETRIKSPCGKAANKTGTGHWGHGPYAWVTAETR